MFQRSSRQRREQKYQPDAQAHRACKDAESAGSGQMTSAIGTEEESMTTQLKPNEPLAPRHPLPRSSQVDRDAYLLDLCRGKKILHLACAAWPATQMWCNDGSLLHLQMLKVADRVAGFDWSEEGLGILKKHDVPDLHRLNLLEPNQVAEGWEKLGFEPDIVVAGELLEHLDRAGLVLENCRKMMKPECKMVITVPNAFSVRSLLHVLRGYEKVAPDHVSYYSYSNVRELAERNGFSLDSVNWYRYSPARKAIDRVVDTAIAPVIWMWPQLSEGLIAECSIA